MVSRALPPGLESRPLTHADISDAFTLYAAAEAAAIGEVAIELADVESDWARASFDLATESIGVFRGTRLVGAAEVFLARRAEGAVIPDEMGHGIGSWLLDWTERCARDHGGPVVGQTVPAGSAAETLLRARGYRLGGTSWVLDLPEGADVAPQPLPPGYRLRTFAGGEDQQAAYQLIEDAFNEWPDRQPSTFADWAPRVVGRTGFEPWQLRFAVDAQDIPVGVAFTILDSAGCGYIDQLAVHRDHRDRGLARALLGDAFKGVRARGATRSELATDSRTGALGLYEHVGMVVTQTWNHWQTDL